MDIFFTICLMIFIIGIVVTTTRKRLNNLDRKLCSQDDVKDLYYHSDRDFKKLILDFQKSTAQELSDLVYTLVEKLDKNSRCPNCSAICIEKQKHCNQCGKAFFTPEPETVKARILSSYGGPDTDYRFAIDWQCLQCHNQETIEYGDDELDGVCIKIVPLECKKCDDICGEVIIKEGNPIKISKVFIHGQFDLSNAENAFFSENNVDKPKKK